MQNLTQEDIKNTIVLISKAEIKGSEALPVAVLLQKYNSMLVLKIPETTSETTSTEDKKVV